MRLAFDLGLLNVGGVIAMIAAHNGVFSRLRQDLELVREAAADRARVGLDRAESQAATGEDPPVGLEHVLILAPAVFDAMMEAVSVFHYEFSSAHETESRAHLVAKLG